MGMVKKKQERNDAKERERGLCVVQQCNTGSRCVVPVCHVCV